MESNDIDYVFKVVMVGDSGVGKTSLVNRYVHDEFEDCRMRATTCKVPNFSTRTLSLKDKMIRARIWDTMGEERFRQLRREHCRGALGALVVYDVTDRRTFESLERWLEDLKDNADSSVRLILVGNKTDLDQRRAVSTEEGQALAEKQNSLFIETSAMNSTNVTEAFNSLLRDVLQTQVAELGMQPNAVSPPTPVENTMAESKMSCTCL